MIVLRVTPESNVNVKKRCFKSDRLDYFFSKVYYCGDKVDVYDVKDKKRKQLEISEVSSYQHRIVINERKFYICSFRFVRQKVG